MQRKREMSQSDRIVFNGHDLSSLAYCKVNRSVMPPVDASFQTIGGRHGERFKRARLGGYDLAVDMWIRTEHRREVAEARHVLAAMLWTDEPAPLYLPDDPTRYLLAIVGGDTDLGEITDDCPTTTVSFHIGDPISYGQKRRQNVVAGDIYLDAGGTWPTYLSLTATPSPGASWRLTNIDTGEFVEIRTALTASNVIRIDMADERATVNQATASVTIDSDFFSVEGRTHLKLSGGSAVIEWRERWL